MLHLFPTKHHYNDQMLSTSSRVLQKTVHFKVTGFTFWHQSISPKWMEMHTVPIDCDKQ